MSSPYRNGRESLGVWEPQQLRMDIMQELVISNLGAPKAVPTNKKAKNIFMIWTADPPSLDRTGHCVWPQSRRWNGNPAAGGGKGFHRRGIAVRAVLGEIITNETNGTSHLVQFIELWLYNLYFSCTSDNSTTCTVNRETNSVSAALRGSDLFRFNSFSCGNCDEAQLR